MLGIDATTLFSLSGKIALITGGSRGIGRMIAEGFVRSGATVYIASRRRETCEQTAAELSAIGPCHALPADIATSEGRTSLVRALETKEASLHILVNNAVPRLLAIRRKGSRRCSTSTWPRSFF